MSSELIPRTVQYLYVPLTAYSWMSFLFLLLLPCSSFLTLSALNVDLWPCLQSYNVSDVLYLDVLWLTSFFFSYGESHCASVGCIVDGCPPGMKLTEADIQPQLTRRRPGQSALTTPRNEKDQVHIQSGTELGLTLGTPIGLLVKNEDHRPQDYKGDTMAGFPRPSHAG